MWAHANWAASTDANPIRKRLPSPGPSGYPLATHARGGTLGGLGGMPLNLYVGIIDIV